MNRFKKGILSLMLLMIFVLVSSNGYVADGGLYGLSPSENNNASGGAERHTLEGERNISDHEACTCSSMVGTWDVGLDFNCDTVTDANRTFTLAANDTWSAPGFPNGGPWTHNGCNVTLTDEFEDPDVIWQGSFQYGLLSGTYSNGAAINGCSVATPNNFTVDENTCGIPTVNHSGLIIFMILAGLGAVYYIRRRMTN